MSAKIARPPAIISVKGFEATSANLTALLERIRWDASIEAVTFLAPPAEDDVEQLRRCLRRAPHVTSADFAFVALGKSGIERWLSACPSGTLIGLIGHGSAVEFSDAFVLEMQDRALKKLHFRGAHESSVGMVRRQASLVALDWAGASRQKLSLAEEARTCRLLSTFGQLHSLVFGCGTGLSFNMAAALTKALAESRTLTSLELREDEDADDPTSVEALWDGLRYSRTCVLRRLVVQGSCGQFAGLSGFLATSHARLHLVELRLTGFDRPCALRLLPIIAANCLGLVMLDLCFDFTCPLLTRVNMAAKSEEGESCCRLSTLNLNITIKETQAQQLAQDKATLRSFVERVSSREHLERLSATLNSGLQHLLFDGALQPAMVRVRCLDLDLRSGDAQVDKNLLAALAQSQNLETLTLRNAHKGLGLPLVRWFDRGAPPTLVAVSLGIHGLSGALYVRFLKALSQCALRHLQLEDYGTTIGARRDLLRAAIVRFLNASPLLQTLKLRANAFSEDCEWLHKAVHGRSFDFVEDEGDGFGSFHATKQASDAAVRCVIEAHPCLEATNLITASAADKLMFDARRLRRHRLAAHWAQVGILLAFARKHDRTLQGSVVPLLPNILALAGLVLSAQHWAESFTASLYFAHASSEQPFVAPRAEQPDKSRRRKRKR